MIALDTKERVVYKDGGRISLTPGEQDLLIVFYREGDRLLSMDALIDLTFNNPVKVPQDRGRILSLIFRLRQKIDPGIIVNKRNAGYRIAEEIQIVN